MQAYGRRVAVIGAGPSGLAAARHLKAHGFDPVVYDQGDRLDTASAAPATDAEGPRRIARFSDFADSAATRSEGDVAAYLSRYAEMFGLTGGLRHDTIVETLARHPTGGWVVHSVKRGEAPRTELYPRVVVAAGRFSGPAHPAIPGIDGFSGCCGVLHSSDYRGPEPFTGKRVLVAGSSIAALEIASDLAVSGAAHVFSTAWQQRCVLQKAGGASGENVARTRFATLAGEFMPLEAVAAGLHRPGVRRSGRAVEFGAERLEQELFDAWIALSERYVELVASDRIVTKRQVESVEARTVRFADSSTAEVDAIVYDTDFAMELPFLDRRTRQLLGLENGRLDLPDLTFHPELEGLAFVGLFPQAGPYFPVVELQARWVADVWAGLAPAPSKTATPVAANTEPVRRREPRDETARAMALRFA